VRQARRLGGSASCPAGSECPTCTGAELRGSALSWLALPGPVRTARRASCARCRAAQRSAARSTLAYVDRVTDEDQPSAALLRDLIERVRDGRTISDLLASTADGDAITAQLRPVCDHCSINSIAGSDSRVDAVITTDAGGARVVFARDETGLLTWLHTYIQPARFAGVRGGRVIVVNGPSGAGKSTLMLSLQSIAPFPLVVLDEPEQIGTVQPGYLIWRDSAPSLHRGYLAAIGALARAGNHVTLSAAGHSHDEIVDVFSGIELICVGMRCDFDVLVHRERRTGRWAGIAAASLQVHGGWTYDLEIDTTNAPDPLEIARRVLDLIAP